MGYARGSDHLILAYVLKGDPKIIKDQGWCWVIENPLDWSYSYCLPLLIITFGNGKEVDFLEEALN